jgi:uncharacterized protein (TIGR03118 family)
MNGPRVTSIARRILSPAGRTARSKQRRTCPRLEDLEARQVLSSSVNTLYLQTNLVSNMQGTAQAFDPNLQDPWGISFSTSSPMWVSDQASNLNGSSVATLYKVDPATGALSVIPVTFGVPNLGGAAPNVATNGPTGQVNTSALGITTISTDFPLNGKKASFIFANLDGSISAWNGGPNATVIPSVAGASFTGLAIANDQTGAAFLYAADQNSGNVFVFNSDWVTTGKLTDPNGLPAGDTAFNVQNINGLLYVTYANQSVPAGGIVDVFKPDGTFDGRLIDDPTGKWLDQPWGLTMAPQSFGKFGGDLLVGNNGGNNWINAFDPTKGTFKGTVTLTSGQPFSENNLWTLSFGNGGSGGLGNTLYFTAGPGGSDGLLGSLQAVPSLSAKAPIVPNLPKGAFQTLTTVPSNGDVNPYGVAFVPSGFPSGGSISPGDILVSNFNNSANQQGTGTTIVAITPNGGESTFFQGPSTPGQLGLTTALGVLKSGFVIVGSVPATYDSLGNLVSVGQGSLMILDRHGNVVTSISDSLFLDGPWDLTVNDQGKAAQVFVSNVLNGVVTRMDLSIPKNSNPVIESLTRIGSGFLTRTDPAALVVGPTGLAFDAKRNLLYVASTGDNTIFAIPKAASRSSDAGTGRVVYQDNAHLRGPLGLALAPNGDLITANGDAVNPDPNQASELVEFTPKGKFVGQFSIDPAQGGAFGVAVTNVGGVLRLAAVEDVTNSVDVWTFSTSKGRSASKVTWANRAIPPAAKFVTAIDRTSGSRHATSTAPVVAQATSSGIPTMNSALSMSRRFAPAPGGNSPAFKRLLSVMRESEMASTPLSRHRASWGQV